MPPPEPLYVGYVLKRYPRFSETFVVNEILAHERAGARIDIFALGPVEETHFQDAIARVRAPVTRLPDRARAASAGWPALMRARALLPGLWQALPRAEGDDPHVAWQAVLLALHARERGIGLLHAHFGTQAAAVARLAAAFAGLPYTFTAHAKDIFYAYEQPQRLDRKLRDAAGAITVSDYNLAHLRRCYGDAAARVVRLYNGLDLAQFRYQEPAERPPHVLAVGRLVSKKGFAVLVDALALLHARGLAFDGTLIGDGPLRAELQQRIDAAGLAGRIVLAGPRPQPEVMEALRGAAVLAAPCVVGEGGDQDGLPTVLVEAMALGTPCISTRVAGIPELVRDGETGLCVPPGDPAALADAIARLLADGALARRLSGSARRLVEHAYDVDRNSAAQRALFRHAIADHAAAAGKAA
ncbi:glycosyltransferase [Pseudorhodoferax sp.]|uniref:glycosyltransferase n=1 Tax=Pseudorhodoferax sp. TaxID=1993553 RepID=UPI0039E643B4